MLHDEVLAIKVRAIEMIERCCAYCGPIEMLLEIDNTGVVQLHSSSFTLSGLLSHALTRRE